MKYIDADKLIERLEEMKRAEYENCGGMNSKTGALQEVQELIASLQQEQPEVDLEKEMKEYFNGWTETDEGIACHYQYVDLNTCRGIAHHFYKLGLNTRKEK